MNHAASGHNVCLSASFRRGLGAAASMLRIRAEAAPEALRMFRDYGLRGRIAASGHTTVAKLIPERNQGAGKSA